MNLAYHHHVASTWPRSGRHILASHDDESVVVYQAYAPAIGRFAAARGYFGGPAFSLSRMSWIKPNFLWMMYRSGWGTKEGQEVTLAVRIRRSAFDAILAEAVPSSYSSALFTTRDDWERAVKTSEVRLQWDPDHGPSGAPLERRAIQLGLRGSFLARYAREWILSIEDISALVEEERGRRGSDELRVPSERVYSPSDPEVVRRLGLASMTATAAAASVE